MPKGGRKKPPPTNTTTTPSPYNNRAWKRASIRKRKQATIDGDGYGCEPCRSVGVMSTADVTDHMVRIEAGGAMNDPRNHMAMCTLCHNKKRGYEGSGWTLDSKMGMDGLIPMDKEDVFKLLWPHGAVP